VAGGGLTPEDEVLRVRGELHSAMRDQLAQLVEEQTGQRVLAYMDESSTDRDLVLYVYMLAPEGGALEAVAPPTTCRP
jgi:hypothetical protein